jgi:PII-like signaling protein
MSEDLPLVIDIVDRGERIEKVLPQLDAMIGEGLMTLADVEVILYRGPQPGDA